MRALAIVSGRHLDRLLLVSAGCEGAPVLNRAWHLTAAASGQITTGECPSQSALSHEPPAATSTTAMDCPRTSPYDGTVRRTAVLGRHGRSIHVNADANELVRLHESELDDTSACPLTCNLCCTLIVQVAYELFSTYVQWWSCATLSSLAFGNTVIAANREPNAGLGWHARSYFV